MLRGTLINLSDYFIKSFEKSVSVPRNIFLFVYYNAVYWINESQWTTLLFFLFF